MEQVVTTVSGYHGSERFKLIKLLSLAGANYVGKMSRSITHLVCWKFEGKKYGVARKLRILVVNHRWFEDCIKEGRRVPEDSYILQSGHEVGPLLLDVPVTVQASSLTKNKGVRDTLCVVGSERQNTELGFGLCGISALEDSSSMKEHDESSSYSSRRSRKNKRNICSGNEVSTVAGHSRKGRKLVKNDVDVVVLDLDPIILDLSQDDQLYRMDRLHAEAAATSGLSGGINTNNIQENTEGLDAGLCNQSRTINGGSDGSGTEFIEDPLPVPQTLVDLCSSAEDFTDGDPVDNVAGLPMSNGLSCVICFTDFSSTRGILPCGHRFCFSCIQRWVDHRISMGKKSTCPLCKESFVMIKKVEHAATTDQKVYSQTIPCGYSATDVFIPIGQELPDNSFESSQAGACVVCRGREPEDLLENCVVCRTRRIHSYCMDPPSRPWTCTHCKELRMLYRNRSY